jgi:hypothetical protein
VASAVDVFIRELDKAQVSKGSLEIDRIARISLGSGIVVPHNVQDMKVWEASDAYGSIGYFGWNMISKLMATYYMTGEEHYAREFIRLSFPDERAKQEIAEIDGEMIENKDEPLSGPYHYNAHLMILFWDLIEESPVFSDEERLRITNAFSKQLDHRIEKENIYKLTSPPGHVGTRHGQWGAISLYCLARYFQRDYPNPVWEHSIQASQMYFEPLNEHSWINNDNDNTFWYNTAIAPIFDYLLLSGERIPVENGVLKTLTRGFEILLSGEPKDVNLEYAAVNFLHKAAYLLDDGRFNHYRKRTNEKMDVFRLGQSFWPEEQLAPVPPDDLVGKWSIRQLPEPYWRERNNGFPLEESFYYGSYRSTPDDTGDFILVDGMYGDARVPYHVLDILQLRMNGLTLLHGYHNQVLTSSNGIVEPKIAKSAALRYSDVLGQTAIVAAELPDAAFCNWQRTLVHKTGKYSIITDDFIFDKNSDNMEIEFLWETSDKVTLSVADDGSVDTSLRGNIASLKWFDKVKQTQRKSFFTVIAPDVENAGYKPQCVRVAENAAALSLPEPGVVVSGKFLGIEGGLVVLTRDHLFGKNISKAGFDSNIISFSHPVVLDWDFISGHLEVVTDKITTLVIGDGSGSGKGETNVLLPLGRSTLENIRPKQKMIENISVNLRRLIDQGRDNRELLKSIEVEKTYPEYKEVFSSEIGGEIKELLTVTVDQKKYICVAEGTAVHILNSKGKEIRTLKTKGEIRKIHWWKEHELLIVGCVDEQVVAFGIKGRKRWSFTSVMDPEVFRAAKTYWFKSAPGHEGIHGLYSGVFLNDESQLFVGSACTIEILNDKGKLLKRMPQFWGPPSTFVIVDGPDSSLNLLAGRRITGSHKVGIINNKTLDPSPRGFHTVPSGHTQITGFTKLNRNHLFYEDLNNDGIKEVVSEINGIWSRITVWNAQGEALYDVNLGPGDPIPYVYESGDVAFPSVNIKDLEICDINADGNKEIIAATWKGDVIAFDYRCNRIWSLRLPSVPMVIKSISSPGPGLSNIVVGCENGDVYLLDSNGSIVRKGKVNGKPTCIASYSSPSVFAGVVIGTAQGEITIFKVDFGSQGE